MKDYIEEYNPDMPFFMIEFEERKKYFYYIDNLDPDEKRKKSPAVLY